MQTRSSRRMFRPLAVSPRCETSHHFTRKASSNRNDNTALSPAERTRRKQPSTRGDTTAPLDHKRINVSKKSSQEMPRVQTTERKGRRTDHGTIHPWGPRARGRGRGRKGRGTGKERKGQKDALGI